MAYIGTPYEFSSNRNTTRTFDCSDFIRQIFLDGVNLTLPSDSRKQADYVKENGQTSSNWRKLERGDLMFFMSYKGSKHDDYRGIDLKQQRISHVGIYL